MNRYLHEVEAQLGALSRRDRARALEALSAQLNELADADIDPVEALGPAEQYAADLRDALTGDAPAVDSRLRVLGVPFELRGPVSAEVRSRTWDPDTPRLFVPRLFGAGWTVNLGALAVRLRLIRPDDATSDVLDRVPQSAVSGAQLVPLAIAATAAGSLALTWRRLPDRVATGFGIGGRRTGTGSRRSLIAAVAVGAVPALWAQRRRAPVEDRLVRTASATTLATLSASIVAATVLDARRPRGRWGLLVPAALPAGLAAALAVIVLPLRAGLRRAWRDARAEGAAAGTAEGAAAGTAAESSR